jgi:hypothetical protein
MTQEDFLCWGYVVDFNFALFTVKLGITLKKKLKNTQTKKKKFAAGFLLDLHILLSIAKPIQFLQMRQD